MKEATIKELLKSEFSEPTSLEWLARKKASISGFWHGYCTAKSLDADTRMKGFEVIADWDEKQFNRIWKTLTQAEKLAAANKRI